MVKSMAAPFFSLGSQSSPHKWPLGAALWSQADLGVLSPTLDPGMEKKFLRVSRDEAETFINELLLEN